jgi:hypothetical protein
MAVRRNLPSRTAAALVAVLLVAGWAANASAADILLFNLDPAGVGLNDPTPAAPVGGNPGTTLGQQRQIAYLYAADVWGGVLASDVPILVGASFQPLTCSPTSGTLGSAGTTFIFRDFPGAIEASTWYHSALADALAGVELNPNTLDINSRFNSRIGTDPGCLTGRGWYYGLDHNEGVDFDFLAVVMHEIGHGIGFSNFVNEVNGALQSGFSDVYANRTYDVTTGKTWDVMSQTERAISAVNDRNVVWIGNEVTAQAPNVLGPRPSLKIVSPPTLQGSLEVQAASFGPALATGGGVTGKVVLADDGNGATADACEPLVNNANGKIVLADRGVCGFVVKVANAQAAGAKGVVIANNVAVGLPGMGGSDPSIVIPSVGVSLADGDALKAALSPSLNVKLLLDSSEAAGAVDGWVRLYAPNPVQSGSSGSHWDVTTTPNLLMEPAINSDLIPAIDLDLTPALLQDIGWTLLP